MKRFVSFLVFSFVFSGFVHAEVKLPAIFGNNMVLQQKIACPVWGWADPGEDVSVSIAGQIKTAKADENGKWSVKLDPLDVGEPLSMTVKGKNELKFENVLVGEVWIGSGQSNMQWNVQNSTNSKDDIDKAELPNIRLITVPCVAKTEPQNDFNGKWEPCSPKTVPNFSGILFFFGRKLNADLNVPVGLIHCSWGGSSCEAWVNEKLLEGKPEYEKMFERRKAFDPEDPQLRINHQVGYLYNGMLHPIIGYGIKGAIWYQGETNSWRAYQHRTLFPLMVENWRTEWKQRGGQETLSFYWAQLANFMATKDTPADSAWAEFRESQSMSRSIKNSGEAVIIDIGEAKDIHPRNKQDVGYRLAILALNNDYGKTQPCESPRFKSATFESDHAVVKFENAYNGLFSRGALPTGFSIAGEDKVFYWASAEIVDKDTVIVRSPKVAKPVAVRYGWADNPVVTLYNSAKLPMDPFRTDDWPGITANNQ